MTEDELHEEAHHNAEYEVREVLRSTFFDEGLHACRALVLVNVLAEELLAIDDVEDVSEVLGLIGTLIGTRMMQDREILNTEGSA